MSGVSLFVFQDVDAFKFFCEDAEKRRLADEQAGTLFTYYQAQAASDAGPMSAHKVLVLHGPNLNLLGERQPEIYGCETLNDINNRLYDIGNRLYEKSARGGWELICRQSNHEDELIDAMHAARCGGTEQLIVINPAAYTHTSVASLDALNAFDGRVIEVHLSNIHKSEAFRHYSYVALRADAVITGLGSRGYSLALDTLL